MSVAFLLIAILLVTGEMLVSPGGGRDLLAASAIGCVMVSSLLREPQP